MKSARAHINDSTNIKKVLKASFSALQGSVGKFFCVDGYDYGKILNILSKDPYNMLCYSISFHSLSVVHRVSTLKFVYDSSTHFSLTKMPLYYDCMLQMA